MFSLWGSQRGMRSLERGTPVRVTVSALPRPGLMSDLTHVRAMLIHSRQRPSDAGSLAELLLPALRPCLRSQAWPLTGFGSFQMDAHNQWRLSWSTSCK